MNLMNMTILIGSLVTAAGVIIGAIVKVFKDVMKPVTNKIDDMDERQCKAFLVDFLNELEAGETKDSVQFALACEIYDHYTHVLKKNSYIHDK